MVVDLDKGGRIPQVVNTYAGPTKGWIQTDSPVDIQWMLEGGGVDIPSGAKPPVQSPDWLVVSSWILYARESGSIVCDIWKVTQDQYLAGTIPSASNSICGSAKPQMSSAKSATSSTLTGWTTNIAQNDVLVLNIDSIAALFGFTLVLKCQRIVGQWSAPL